MTRNRAAESAPWRTCMKCVWEQKGEQSVWTEKTDGFTGKVAPEVDTQGKQLCAQVLFIIAEQCHNLNGHVKGDPLNKLWYGHRREPM